MVPTAHPDGVSFARRTAGGLLVVATLVAGDPGTVAAQDGWLRPISDGWSVVQPAREGQTAQSRPVDLGTLTWDLAGAGPRAATLRLTRRVHTRDGPLAVGVGPVALAAYTLRVDGRTVGRHGGEGAPLPLARPRAFRLPGAASRDSVTLELHIERPAWAGRVAAAGVPVVRGATIGSPGQVEAGVQAVVERGRLGSLAILLFAVIALAAGVYHFVLYLIRRTERGYLWFGLGAVAFGANALASSVWAAAVHDRLDLLFRFADGTGHLTAAFLMTFVWTIVDRPFGRLARLYRDSHFLLAVGVLIAPMTWVVASSVPRLIWLFVLLFLASRLLIREAYRGRTDARVLLVGAAAVVLAQTGEFLRVVGWPLPADMPYVGFSLVLLSMAAALALRFSRAHSELDLLRLGLESQVEERTRRLEEMTQVAERANATKGDLLATLSHELREPLKSVAAFAHLLSEGFDESDQVTDRDRDFVRRLERSGQVALGLVTDLLDLSRLETGRLRLEVEPVELAELLEDVRAVMLPEADVRNAELVVETPPPLAPVETDPMRLRQVLVNLVGNALKFSPDGRVTLRVREREGRALAVEVVDTGVGIPDEILAQIRAGGGVHPSGDTLSKEGVGIGLRISRALCELLDLNLEFESAVGVGTTARVLLPSPPGGED